MPVYNVEKYICRSIESVMTQTLTNIEIIIVDDCGNDRSIPMVQGYLKKDNRIRIIRHDINQGLGQARNTGIENSKGKYIFFLDSDDWIEKNTLEIMYNMCIETQSQIVECGSKLVYDNGNTNSFLSNNLGTKDRCEALALMSEHKIGFMAWDKLYDAEFIKSKNLKFPKILHEDINFAIQCAYYANKIVVIPNELYNYYQRDNSISNTTITSKHLDSYFEVINNLSTFAKEVDLYSQNPEIIEKLFNSITNWLLDNLLKFYSGEGNSIEKKQNVIKSLSKYSNNEFFVNSMLNFLLNNIIYEKSKLNKKNVKNTLKTLFRRFVKI